MLRHFLYCPLAPFLSSRTRSVVIILNTIIVLGARISLSLLAGGLFASAGFRLLLSIAVFSDGASTDTSGVRILLLGFRTIRDISLQEETDNLIPLGIKRMWLLQT
jgi:hypothetical protein